VRAGAARSVAASAFQAGLRASFGSKGKGREGRRSLRQAWELHS
jgi:hypothetical protein